MLMIMMLMMTHCKQVLVLHLKSHNPVIRTPLKREDYDSGQDGLAPPGITVGPGALPNHPALYLTDYLTSSQALRVNQMASANVLLSAHYSWLLIGSHSARPHQ